ncbi:DUF202 domain-containing protein [Candidatus Peregrinibacteria bacterium]|nr:DUF202 domain-containing protein [Candidatus Peregrinibacteria bacterium]
MLKNMHQHYHEGHLNLRDYLGAHRTLLANDRTWLAYIRTALTFFVAGVSFIQFFKSQLLIVIGWTFVPVGIVFLVLGFWKYLKVRYLIHSIKGNSDEIKEI